MCNLCSKHYVALWNVRIFITHHNPHSLEVYGLCTDDGETGVLIYVALITEIGLSWCFNALIMLTCREGTVTLSDRLSAVSLMSRSFTVFPIQEQNRTPCKPEVLSGTFQGTVCFFCFFLLLVPHVPL